MHEIIEVLSQPFQQFSLSVHNIFKIPNLITNQNSLPFSELVYSLLPFLNICIVYKTLRNIFFFQYWLNTAYSRWKKNKAIISHFNPTIVILRILLVPDLGLTVIELPNISSKKISNYLRNYVKPLQELHFINLIKLTIMPSATWPLKFCSWQHFRHYF